MKKLWIAFLLLMSVACSTKYNYIDTGVSNGEFEGSMMDYLKNMPYNWDTVALMIERADLVNLFEGKKEGFEQITFFGPTNHTVRNWMLDSGYMTVADIPVDICRASILKHVVKGRYLSTDIPRGSVGTSAGEEPEGGIELTTLGGRKLWLYTVQSPWMGVEGAGPLTLYVRSLAAAAIVPLGCPDIQTNNGVVCSLDYSYYFGEI